VDPILENISQTRVLIPLIVMTVTWILVVRLSGFLNGSIGVDSLRQSHRRLIRATHVGSAIALAAVAFVPGPDSGFTALVSGAIAAAAVIVHRRLAPRRHSRWDQGRTRWLATVAIAATILTTAAFSGPAFAGLFAMAMLTVRHLLLEKLLLSDLTRDLRDLQTYVLTLRATRTSSAAVSRADDKFPKAS